MLRFAPSPTADMHISDLRVAIVNYLVSQQKNDNFLIRIEDTNTKRNIEGKDTEIMMILEKFAIKHDAVFHQTEHRNLHQTLALRLLKDGKAFVCKCKEETLEKEREEAKANNIIYSYSGHCENLKPEDYKQLKESGDSFLIRIKRPTEDIVAHDLIQGEISNKPNEVDAFIISERDGTPSYDFATASDDMMSDINFVIRRDKYLDNTPKQIHIKNLLGYEDETLYAHLPTILNHEEKEMNPNDDGYLVKWLFQEGFIPDAILNYLILLGYDNAPKEIFKLPEAIEWFDLKNISKSPAKFDMDRLRFINREHLKFIDDKQMSTLFGFADADIGRLAKLYLTDSSTINELEKKIRPIFTSKDFSNEWGEEMIIISKIIANAPAFESFEAFKQHITVESGLEEKDITKPLRYLLTGAGDGPALSEIYPFIKSYILEVAS